MTQEEYNQEIKNAMTDLMVNNQIELYQAIKEERYEDAALLRDKMTHIIEESLKVFTKISKLSKEELREYFNDTANKMLEEIEKNDKKKKK